MTDQCSRFASRGLRTAFMGEAQMDREVKKLALLGEYQLLYLTPESLMSSHSVYRDTLLSSKYKDNLVALVVDEAHCCKLWGDKFREAFTRIGDIRSVIPSNVNIMALTATATTDISCCLQTFINERTSSDSFAL